MISLSIRQIEDRLRQFIEQGYYPFEEIVDLIKQSTALQEEIASEIRDMDEELLRPLREAKKTMAAAEQELRQALTVQMLEMYEQHKIKRFGGVELKIGKAGRVVFPEPGTSEHSLLTAWLLRYRPDLLKVEIRVRDAQAWARSTCELDPEWCRERGMEIVKSDTVSILENSDEE